MKKVGTFFGIEVWEDQRLPPGHARMVSWTWDPVEQRMRKLDSVSIVNLATVPTHSISTGTFGPDPALVCDRAALRRPGPAGFDPGQRKK